MILSGLALTFLVFIRAALRAAVSSPKDADKIIRIRRGTSSFADLWSCVLGLKLLWSIVPMRDEHQNKKKIPQECHLSGQAKAECFAVVD
jgi:hypothetical protein